MVAKRAVLQLLISMILLVLVSSLIAGPEVPVCLRFGAIMVNGCNNPSWNSFRHLARWYHKFQKYFSVGKLNLHSMGATTRPATSPPILLVSIAPPTFSPWRPGDAYSREKAEVRTIAKNCHICLSNVCSILKSIFLKVHLPDETTARCIMYGHSSVRSYSFGGQL